MYGMLNHEIDMVLNDQRWAFSDEYGNLELAVPPVLIEVSARHYLGSLEQVEIPSLHPSGRTGAAGAYPEKKKRTPGTSQNPWRPHTKRGVLRYGK